MWNLKKKIVQKNQSTNRNRVTDIENKYGYHGGERGWEG